METQKRKWTRKKVVELQGNELETISGTLVYIKLESRKERKDYGETLNKIVTKILNFILKIINSSSPKA